MFTSPAPRPPAREPSTRDPATPRSTVRSQLGALKYRWQQALRAYLYRRPTPWSRRLIAAEWEKQAEMIHQRWGEETHDYAVLGQILAERRPTTLLDIGCGSGRLFPLYQQQGIDEVVGVDISQRALDLARARFPAITTHCTPIEQLHFPAQRFDLTISNRVLQHIPHHTIAAVIAAVCSYSRLVYINELSESDGIPEEYYMFRHPYPALFAQAGRQQLQQGQIGAQTYQLYG